MIMLPIYGHLTDHLDRTCYNIMVRKLIRIGNSNGVTLDKKMLQVVGLNRATYVVIEPDKKQKRIIIRERKENDW